MNASIPRCDFNFENPSSENTKSIFVHASATTVVILLLAAFWVPIDVSWRNYYDNGNLFAHFAPRALFGTIVKILLPRWAGFILLRQLFETLWLFLIVFQITKSLGSPKVSSSSLLEVLVLSFLFGFNTVVFTTNGLSALIDVVPYALVLCAVPLLLPVDGASQSLVASQRPCCSFQQLWSTKRVFSTLQS